MNVHGTEPLLTDTDDDGLEDDDELSTHGTSPILPDTDGDSLSDGDEVNVYGTSPTLTDTEGDGLTDDDELQVYATDPLVDADADGDTISDSDEVSRAMNPHLTDTDGDGFSDLADNCPSAYNPKQLDVAGLGVATPDGIGDACQNGDFNRDGSPDILDVTLQRRALIGLEPTLDPALPPSTP